MVKKSNREDMKLNKFFRYFLIIAGIVFLGFGIIGIFLPILPTTPFLLLAAACFARSSQRFYNWLMNNRWFGSYIKNYREGRGIPLRFKIFTISLLWLTISASVYCVINNFWIQIILIIIAISVTVHVLTIRTYRHKN
ncbi:MAG: YbaN family protein [Candidatus Thermoplasmatota archaeon]|nr:YbaN family protein [Candidatus Thermoplasmatota archaeon]